jgi:hypothetical protein
MKSKLLRNVSDPKQSIEEVKNMSESDKKEYEEFGNKERWDVLDTLHDIRLELAVITAIMLGGVAVGIVAFVWFFMR